MSRGENADDREAVGFKSLSLTIYRRDPAHSTGGASLTPDAWDRRAAAVVMATWAEVARLESRMSSDDFAKLQSLFLDSSGLAQPLSRADFVAGAVSSLGHGSAEDYGLLFDSAALSRQNRALLLDMDALRAEGLVDWPGLCSFLHLQLSEKAENSQPSNAPRWESPRTLASPHRDPIQKVVFAQTWGRYLSVSRRGTVVLRGREDMSPLHMLSLQNSTVRHRDLWVTAVALLHNLDKVAASFTSKEVCLYEMSSKPDFICKYKIQGFKFTPWCLDYWADPSLPDQAALALGDIGGQVSLLCFTSAQISLFESRWARPDTDSTADVILWDELLSGRHHCCYAVSHRAHQPAWVRRVRYIGSLGALLSCCTTASSSLAVAWKVSDTDALKLTAFHTKRGVWDMDHHQQLNLIATAGVDHQVLLWDPYVTSKPVGVLRGHDEPVTAVCFMQNKQQLLSFSKDKVLCLWDVSSQQCLSRLSGVFPQTPEDTHSLLFLHEERQLLLISLHSQLVLLRASAPSRTSSHQSPVTCVLYNSLFRQVVSGDSSSSVICWLPDTGQRVKQFSRCHGNAAISTMALDGTRARLFTAGTDGEVKVWDFNGRCLHRMNGGQGRHVRVTQVLPLQRSVLVMGWQRGLSVFRLHSFTQSAVEPSEWRGGVQHSGEVLCAAFQPPQTLVTGSSDGDIIVWNSNLEKGLRKLQMKSAQNEGEEGTRAVTGLLFIPGRERASARGGADLISCDASGSVRFWSSVHSCVLGRFVPHGDLGSVVMAVCPSGRCLATADKEGTVKVWDLQSYRLNPAERETSELPELARVSRPHLSRVTHLEACLHGDRLLLLSASLDSRVAMSLLPGNVIGYFGQEERWSLEGSGPLFNPTDSEDDERERSGATSGQQ